MAVNPNLQATKTQLVRVDSVPPNASMTAKTALIYVDETGAEFDIVSVIAGIFTMLDNLQTQINDIQPQIDALGDRIDALEAP